MSVSFRLVDIGRAWRVCPDFVQNWRQRRAGQKLKTLGTIVIPSVSLVAGTGFEPVTSGL